MKSEITCFYKTLVLQITAKYVDGESLSKKN